MKTEHLQLGIARFRNMHTSRTTLLRKPFPRGMTKAVLRLDRYQATVVVDAPWHNKQNTACHKTLAKH